MVQKEQVRYKFLDWLRCVGVCLIVYDHLGPLRNPDWIVAKTIENVINTPLGIIQYFGAFGVCLFFIISGFCLTTNTPTGLRFIYDKIIRIIVTLLISTLLFYTFNKVISLIFGPTYWSQFPLSDWLESSVLINYLFGKESVINGATWYLFPLMAVYFVWGGLYRLLRKNPVYFAVALEGAFICFWLTGEFRGFQSVYMQWLVFMLLPVFGVLIRAISRKLISAKLFMVMFLMNYIVFLKNIETFRPYYYSEQPYLISLAYAILIFSVFLLLEDKIIVPRFVKFISDISFSLYLLHMSFGGLIMSATGGITSSFTVSFLVTFVAVVLLAKCHYEWIEKTVISKLKLK